VGKASLAVRQLRRVAFGGNKVLAQSLRRLQLAAQAGETLLLTCDRSQPPRTLLRLLRVPLRPYKRHRDRFSQTQRATARQTADFSLAGPAKFARRADNIKRHKQASSDVVKPARSFKDELEENGP
jgi:hypothetical protein